LYDKTLIATRGELVPRVIKVLEERGKSAVTIYSQEEPDALQRKLAKSPHKAVCIGSHTNYANARAILNVATQEGADAIYLGYGFLSEIPEFIEECENKGFETFSSPPKVMELWKNRLTAKKMAERYGLKNVPGSDKVIRYASDVKDLMEEHGPIILKSSVGGGGKVTRVIREFEENEVSKILDNLISREKEYFGSENYNVCAEKVLLDPSPAHLEIQLVADEHGNYRRVGKGRDCSSQRDFQKILEEEPSQKVSIEQFEDISKKVIEAAKNTGLTGLSTFEILYWKGKPYFNEVNTRIQVEHGITEEVTGINLLETQMRVGSGEKIPWSQEEIDRNTRGHAIECRILSEDMIKRRGYPGRITVFRKPETPNTRLDTAIYESCVVPQCFDSKIANLIVKEKDRRGAIEHMKQALENVVIRGENESGEEMHFSMPFHREFLETSEFVNGDYDTRTVETLIKNQEFVDKVRKREDDLKKLHNLLLSASSYLDFTG
jgi:acetyl-CoA carboxylase biotin carboxylase subunit